MKLSPTQRALVLAGLEDPDDQDWFFRNCVYPKNLTGLVRAGAVELVGDLYQVTDAAIVEIRGF